jgi:hypothetical protein
VAEEAVVVVVVEAVAVAGVEMQVEMVKMVQLNGLK